MNQRSEETTAKIAPGSHRGPVWRGGVTVAVLVSCVCFARGQDAGTTCLSTPDLDIKIPLEERRDESEPKWHVFGGRSIDIPFELSGQGDGTLDLRLHVSQLSFSLVAPVERDITVFQGAAMQDVVGSRRVSVELPVVERESTFEISFDARGTPTAPWMSVRSARVRVYPVELLSDIRPWSERVQLRIKDGRGMLQALLDRLDVQHLDARSPLIDKNSPGVTLVADPLSDQEMDAWLVGRGETVIFFRETASNLPAVLVDRRGGTVIRVDLPVLGDLESNPRSQKLFLEILKLSTQQQ